VNVEEYRTELAEDLQRAADGWGAVRVKYPSAVRALAESVRNLSLSHQTLQALCALPDDHQIWGEETVWRYYVPEFTVPSGRSVDDERDYLLARALSDLISSAVVELTLDLEDLEAGEQ
jgi:hypothetical protein